MPRTLNRLTAKAVENYKEAGRYADGGGLYLAVTTRLKRQRTDGLAAINGRRWVFRYRTKGREREMGLGSARAISLAKARELAARAREALAQGIDPLEARRRTQAEAEEARSIAQAQASAALKADVTFGTCADELIRNMSPTWRNAQHAAQWPSTLKAYASALREMPVALVDTAAVLEVLQPIWTKVPETASRLRGRIERVLDYAKAKGLRSGENPARWRGHLDQILPPRRKLARGHHAAHPYEAVGAFMRRLRARDAFAARALEFLILTAARSGEVRGATWEEIDLSKKVWTVSANRMKGHREHRVPLSPAAVTILEMLRPLSSGRFVFSSQAGGRPVDAPLSKSAMPRLLQRLNVKNVTLHGFRSTFRDWAAEETSVANIVAEAALAHVIADKAEAAYRRGDLFERRRALMNDWAAYCAEPPKLATVAEVAA